MKHVPPTPARAPRPPARGEPAPARAEPALVEFDKEREPTDARNFLQIAEAHARRGEVREALEAYRHAVHVHVEQGFHRHAVAICKKILGLAPGDLDAHRTLARLFAKLGMLSDATTQYEYVVQACQLARRSDEALEALRCIAGLNPADVRIQLRYVDSAFQAGLRKEAIERLQAAAHLLKSSGRIDEFLRIGERLLRERPGDTALARDLAKAYIVRGNGRYALARLRVCFEQAPQDVETLDLMAQGFDLLGERERAVSLLKALGQIHRSQGRFAQAQDVLHRALDINPADPELLHLLAESTRARRISEVEIPIDLEHPLSAGPSTPAVPGLEAEALRTSLPEFITADEIRAVDPTGPGGGRPMDLFPLAEARRLTAECQLQVERTVAQLRRLAGMLPVHMSSRALIERALESLLPDGELAAELAILADSLSSNRWVDELQPVAPTTTGR